MFFVIQLSTQQELKLGVSTDLFGPFQTTDGSGSPETDAMSFITQFGDDDKHTQWVITTPTAGINIAS